MNHQTASSSEIIASPNGGVNRHWERHPADLARLVFAVLVGLGFVATSALAPKTITAVSEDFVQLVSNIPLGMRSFLVGVIQLLAVTVPAVVLIVLAVRRRWRLAMLLTFAAAIAGLAMVAANSWLYKRLPPVTLTTQEVDSWLTGAAFPSGTYLAALGAILTASANWLRTPWRRAGWAAFGLVALCRVLTATEVPLNIGVVTAIGFAAGSAALIALGAPSRRTDDATIMAALQRSGIGVTALEPIETALGAPAYSSQTLDGRDVQIQLIGREERDTDLLLRAWRSISVKGLGDHRPVRSPRRAAEHEALALALAHSAGTYAPRIVGTAYTAEGAALLVQTRSDNVSLSQLADPQSIKSNDTVDRDVIDDAALAETWEQVVSLHNRRIAHRALDTTSVVKLSDGIGITEFGRATIDASDEILAADIANLLVSLALIVGVDRAVSSAVSVVPRDELALALPLMQTPALTPTVRRQLKADKNVLQSVRTATGAALDIDKVELTKLHRVSLQGIVGLVGGIVLGGYLLGLVSNWSEIWESLRDADSTVYAWMVLFVVLSFVGGTFSLMGSVTVKLPFLRTLAVMFAQSFLNRFTPANAGGMALRARYLQLEGCDIAVAAAAVGLTSAANGVVQVIFLFTFVFWGGSTSSLGSFSLPDTTTLLIVVLGLAVVAGTIILSSWGKRVVWPTLRDTFGKALGSFRDLGRRPGLLGLLFGGAALSKLVNIIAFMASVRAFGVDMGLAQAGALYMVANTVGSAVPTPGGVGGIEAALTAVLIGAGVDPATAAAIVLLFRLSTFWAPTIPGYGFLRYTQRAGIV